MASIPQKILGRKQPGKGYARLRVPAERAIDSCRVFIDGAPLAGEFTPAAALQKVAEHGQGFVWVALNEPDDHQMTRVSAGFGIHELIVEDAVVAHQRPKLERYDDQLFVVARSVNFRDHDEVTDTREVISTGEVQMLIGHNFIITVRHKANVIDLPKLMAEEQELLNLGPITAAWKILDVLVDSYFDIARLLSAEVDEVEEEVFTPGSTFNIDRIYLYKREILEMKHAIDPLAPALKSMVSDNKDLIPKQIRSYLRDVYDHEMTVKDQVSAFDERLTSLIDASVAKVTMQQNTDMRTISAIVGMAAVPTLVAGIYGMNFDYMPELHARYGYPIALIAMLVTVGLMWWWFRRNNWL